MLKKMKPIQVIAISALAGLVIGLPQGMNDLPKISATIGGPEKWGNIAIIGAIFGFFIGMQLLRKVQSESSNYAGFTFFLVGALSIGLPTIIRHYNGNILYSINFPAAFFTSISFAMVMGGFLSILVNKAHNKI